MASERDIDPRIQRLQSTTFHGKRLTRRQIADIQETVGRFPKLSRTEVGHTLCEQLGWQTPKGRNRIQLTLRVLEELERLGILALPPKQGPGRGRQKPVEPGRRTDPQPAIAGPLAELRPVRLERAQDPEAVAEWNEWVERYHPLGYRQPIGAHLRYFLRDRQGRPLGCLLFDFAARQLGCRDAWIGWSGQAHRPRLDRVVRNARFLLFPWVQVKNLASHALGLALRQLPGDWQRQHGLRPLLAETYTNAERHRGTCYQAANWQRVGRTKGSKAKGERPAKPPKEVWVYPLQANWRELLLGARPTPAARPAPRPEQAAVPPPAAAQPGQSEERFRRMWQSILAAVVRLASEHDREWRKRRRVLDTLLVVLFVFRLVFAPERQGYARTLGELWEQCRRQGIALPQPQPVSAASMCAARAKVRPEVFGRIHRAILERAPRNGPRERWHGHRAFAVDGSKLNLPRPLLADGYRTPSETAFYPQGLLSCLFQLRARLPVDFGLHAHGDERRAALAHLSCLAPGDVVVYDRGYYSFRLLHAHAERGLHAVFRLQSNANAVFAAFFRSQCLDATLTVQPSDAARRQSPAGGLRPCRVRLVKYTAGGTTYGLATTLLDPQRYRIQDLSDLYHARWGIEELYRWSSDYPIPRFRAGTVLPPWPPVRWLGADGPVQPETARWPALAAS